jgi:hypothetical protein
LDQHFIGKSLTGNRADKAFKPRESVMLYIPFIKAEGKFIDVAAKMLWASMMIDANQAALENRENALDAVCGHVISNILAGAVVNGIMAKARVADAGRPSASGYCPVVPALT